MVDLDEIVRGDFGTGRSQHGRQAPTRRTRGAITGALEPVPDLGSVNAVCSERGFQLVGRAGQDGSGHVQAARRARARQFGGLGQHAASVGI